ncbi:MAG: glucose-6-phosphate dehydrogenase, partial [Methylococcaceae bacterium]
MDEDKIANPSIIVIFGAGGDLTHRKLMPAIYNLYLDGLLPQKFAVLGLDIKDLNDTTFRKSLLEGVDQFSRREKIDKSKWKVFEEFLHYQKSDFTDDATYTRLKSEIDRFEKDWDCTVNRVFYMAIPP